MIGATCSRGRSGQLAATYRRFRPSLIRGALGLPEAPQDSKTVPMCHKHALKSRGTELSASVKKSRRVRAKS